MHKLTRSPGWWAAATGLMLGTSCALAQDAYPAKTVRFIAPFPPGGTTDVLSRILAREICRSGTVHDAHRPEAGVGDGQK